VVVGWYIEFFMKELNRFLHNAHEARTSVIHADNALTNGIDCVIGYLWIYLRWTRIKRYHTHEQGRENK
jgi:hypothetical protein